MEEIVAQVLQGLAFLRRPDRRQFESGREASARQILVKHLLSGEWPTEEELAYIIAAFVWRRPAGETGTGS